MMNVIDKFNQLAPGAKADDSNDLSWPGVFSKYYSYDLFYNSYCMLLVLKAF